MHHKRRRARNRRAGCKLCKGWKVNGHGKERVDHYSFGDFRGRLVAAEKIQEVRRECPEKA